MKRIHRLLLALLSVLLLSIPFFHWGTGLLLFVAFVPLLLIEDDMARRKAKARLIGEKVKGSVTWYTVLTFGLFVLWTTYWVYFATWVGIVASLIVNTTYMALTFWLFHYTRRKLGDRLGYAALPIYWLTFEFLYLRAQVNFPWLVLGNGFANDIILIQWYEVTGALGGTLWALVMNLLVFRLVKGMKGILAERAASSRSTISPQGAGSPAFPPRLGDLGPALMANRRRLSWVVAVFLVPFLISWVRYLTYEEKDDPYEMVVLQPNIDPYLKFVEMSQSEQTKRLLLVADSLVTPSTDYIIGPETFINSGVQHSTISRHPEFLKIGDFLEQFPKAKLVMGATTYKIYTEPSEFTESSRPVGRNNYRYDSFNSAFQLDSTWSIPLYHKSLLVTGVEKMPYKNLLGFLEGLTVKLGGTMRSHGTQEYREAFVSPQDDTRVGPVICWESVFGEYVTGYVKDAGANFLFIITNDGWWRNTPGHRQHNAYGRLRAIETRRSIARSANTGISSLINQRGEEIARVGWWVRSGLRGTLNKNDHLTFYVKHGDFMGRIALFLTVILLLYSIVFRFVQKQN